MKPITIALLLFFLLSACSVQKINKTTLIGSEYGILQINGNMFKKTLYLNDQVVKQNMQQRYSLESGTYDLVVTEAKATVLKKMIYITNGNILEVNIP